MSEQLGLTTELHCTWILPLYYRALEMEDRMEFVMFEDVDGMEVFVNPDRVIWVREYPNKTTVISCGHEDRFAVRLSAGQAMAVLGRPIR